MYNVELSVCTIRRYVSLYNVDVSQSGQCGCKSVWTVWRYVSMDSVGGMSVCTVWTYVSMYYVEDISVCSLWEYVSL